MSKAENGVILGAICQHAQSNFLKIIAVIYATYAIAKRSQRSRVQIPYKPEFFFSGFLFATA